LKTLFILGGGKRGLALAKKCRGIHVDYYAEVDPAEVESGVQVHVEDRRQALLFLDVAEAVYVFPDFAELLPHLPHAVVVAPPGHPLCSERPCVEEPCS